MLATGIAFVLLHNDAGGAVQAADAVRRRFRQDLAGSMRTGLDDLVANFAEPGHQGPAAYAKQMEIDHPDLNTATLKADAILAVEAFHCRLFEGA